MTEAEFLRRWHSERLVYDAWGRFVKSAIEEQLRSRIGALSLGEFLKISGAPRLKDDDSLIGKALHRKKGYKDPYREIEDKVGVRFVVLLTQDIRKLEEAVQAVREWNWSLDKDFEADREARPLEFVYQSKHYVVKSAAEIAFGEVTIPADTPCEIQFRTLLQHAHSELTHDNLYKRDPSLPPNRRVERTVAKSMALIEAVDDYFAQAVVELESATQTERTALTELIEAYVAHVGSRPHVDKSNSIVLAAYQDRIGENLRDRLDSFLKRFSFIGESIAKRKLTQYAFRQPWILLAYLMVFEAPNEAAGRWPLTPDELRPIYTDLGKAYPAPS